MYSKAVVAYYDAMFLLFDAFRQPRPQGPPRCPTNDLSSGASHAEGAGDEVGISANFSGGHNATYLINDRFIKCESTEHSR